MERCSLSIPLQLAFFPEDQDGQPSDNYADKFSLHLEGLRDLELWLEKGERGEGEVVEYVTLEHSSGGEV